jgi:hypothetical protein
MRIDVVLPWQSKVVSMSPSPSPPSFKSKSSLIFVFQLPFDRCKERVSRGKTRAGCRKDVSFAGPSPPTLPRFPFDKNSVSRFERDDDIDDDSDGDGGDITRHILPTSWSPCWCSSSCPCSSARRARRVEETLAQLDDLSRRPPRHG